MTINDFSSLPIKNKIVFEGESFVLYDVMWSSNLYCFDKQGVMKWRVGSYQHKECLFIYMSMTNNSVLKVWDIHNRRFDVDLCNGKLSNMEQLLY